MTIAVDTSVIVRYLTLDNPAQAQAATDLLESGDRALARRGGGAVRLLPSA